MDSKKIKNYSNLYTHLFDYLNLIFKVKPIINVEGIANEWRNIDKYLKLNKNFQDIHYIRDPRAVLEFFQKNYFCKKLWLF